MHLSLNVATPDQATLILDAIKPIMADFPVYCFHGDLGAGKTTYIKAVCSALGVQSETSSPSFSIVNEYHTSDEKRVFHFDLYRLKKADELLDIGWSDYLNSNSIMLIEWPEMAEEYMPKDAVHVHIEPNEDESRTVTITQNL